MDFSSQNESGETSPPPRPPVCLTLEELAENLEYLAEDEYTFTLPTYDVPDSDTGVPQHLSIEEVSTSSTLCPTLIPFEISKPHPASF